MAETPIKLTMAQLEAMEPGTIFATGTASDNYLGINMTGSERLLRWVACRGDCPDWAIYVQDVERAPEWIRRFGDKVRDPETIRRVIPCDDEAFARYRP